MHCRSRPSAMQTRCKSRVDREAESVSPSPMLQYDNEDGSLFYFLFLFFIFYVLRICRYFDAAQGRSYSGTNLA